MQLTTELSARITKDQTDMNPPATSIAANTAPPLTMGDENATKPSDVDAPIHPITTMLTTEGRPTTPEGSSTTSTAAMNEPTTAIESLDIDIEHTTLSDQTMTTGVVLDKENDASIVIVDSKLTIVAIYLSASSFALFVALTVAMFVRLLVGLLCTHKRKAKESESANIELTGVREFVTEAMKSKHASNIYTSPTHNYYSSEEKLVNDLM
jgi:hypothetical protein